jgi:mono/diheme cytochrome c family protein
MLAWVNNATNRAVTCPQGPAQAALIEVIGWRIVAAQTHLETSDLQMAMNLSCIARRARRHVSLAVAAILAASPFPLTAQEIGDVAAGKRLAETWCSSCHVVAPSAQTGASTGVPTFAAVARMPSTTPISLRAFLQTPHARMPDLHLNRDETDNLIAYILTLRGH